MFAWRKWCSRSSTSNEYWSFKCTCVECHAMCLHMHAALMYIHAQTYMTKTHTGAWARGAADADVAWGQRQPGSHAEATPRQPEPAVCHAVSKRRSAGVYRRVGACSFLCPWHAFAQSRVCTCVIACVSISMHVLQNATETYAHTSSKSTFQPKSLHSCT